MLFSHADAQAEIFQDRGGLVELGHFDKHFVKKHTKLRSCWEKFFLQDTVKTAFRIKDLIQRWT